MYSARLLEHFRNPKNVGQLDKPAFIVDVTNPACGDMLRLSARFENGRVAEGALSDSRLVHSLHRRGVRFDGMGWRANRAKS